MAMSGLVQGSLTQHADKFRCFLYWQIVNSNDDRINRNRSRVRVIPLIDTTSSYQDWDGNCFNCAISINGASKNYPTFGSSSYSGWTYTNNNSPTGRYAENILEQVGYYYEVDVPHNDDGTKNCNISFYCSLGSGGWGPGEVNISGNINLDTIPRASKISSDPNLIIGNNLTVNISRYSDKFTHTVKYYADLLLIKEASNVATSKTFTWSNSDIQLLYQLTENSKEIETKIVVETYKDNNIVGIEQKKGKLFVNESINRPIFTDFTFEPIDTYTSDLTGWNSAINIDNGKSIATVTKYKITCGSATAKNYASISKYEVELNGKFYTSTSNVINLSNPIVNVDYLKVSVYDSRGFKTTVSKKIIPINYKVPNVKSISVSRANSSTALISAVVEITKSSVFNNEFWAKYRYKHENSTNWNDWTILASSQNDNTYTISTSVQNLSSLSTFYFELKIGDSITTQNFSSTLLKIIPELEIKDGQVFMNGVNNEKIYQFTRLINISSADTWFDTDITGSLELGGDGTYAMEVYINDASINQYNERLSGLVPWYTKTTNSSNTDEIPLSKNGHARNNHDIKLRFLRKTGSNSYSELQISDSISWGSKSAYVEFRFKKII